MELNKQVCSLELSKKLKELGVKQESYLKWNVPDEKPWDDKLYTEADWDTYAEDNLPPNSEMYSAFTVAELGEMLPQYVLKDGFSFELQIVRSSAWRLYYGSPSMEQSIKFTASTNDTEADARAKMLIYLLENKLITV